MRQYLSVFAVMLALAACAQPTRWDKEAVSAEATAADAAHCQEQARAEAIRAVGAYPLGYPFYGPGPYFHGSRLWRYDYGGRLQYDRTVAENRLADFCMRNKGYERVAIEEPKA